MPQRRGLAAFVPCFARIRAKPLVNANKPANFTLPDPRADPGVGTKARGKNGWGW